MLVQKEAIAAAIGFAIVLVAILLFIVIAVATSESQLSGTSVRDSGSLWLNKRLPMSTVPVHYTIQLQVDLQALRVTGMSLSVSAILFQSWVRYSHFNRIEYIFNSDHELHRKCLPDL